MNSPPCYDVSDDSCARLNAMMKTMNEQHEHVISEMRECGLLHDINPSLPFPRIEASLYDDCECSLLLESNAVVVMVKPNTSNHNQTLGRLNLIK